MQAQTEPKLHPEKPTWNLNKLSQSDLQHKLSQSDLQPWRAICRLTWNLNGV